MAHRAGGGGCSGTPTGFLAPQSACSPGGVPNVFKEPGFPPPATVSMLLNSPLMATTYAPAVLLSGAALGSLAGGASQLLYVALGLVGLPFYAGGASGWETATGATGGYLVGFVLAAAFVGYLAERRQDRNVATAVPAFLTGNAIIYVVGIPWLAYRVDGSLIEALELGFVPFVAGDLLKIALAGLLLPVAWKLAGRLGYGSRN